MDNGTCVTSGCERPVWVKSTGECSTCQSRRYRRENPGKGRTFYDLTCESCASQYRAEDRRSRYCSLRCKGDTYRAQVTKLPTNHPVRVLMRAQSRQRQEAAWRAQRSPIRRALESGDHPEVMRLLLEASEPVDGCMLWTRQSKDGYPILRVGKREHMVHRLVLEAKHSAPLGSQHAHHICATPLCINPEHLQPVTHRDNVAEMLARQSYLARIAELEAALLELDPDHPALAVIAVA